jgi:hypothetical protein
MIPLTDEQLRVLVWLRVKEKLTTKHEHKAIDLQLMQLYSPSNSQLEVVFACIFFSRHGMIS